jgi:tRNA-dihydrouridine synthase B
MEIGSHKLSTNLVLAPMAGVTDRPFRQLCRALGAGMAVSEMVTSNPTLWSSRKTRLRLDHIGEESPRTVQIAGADPKIMAVAAKFNMDNGAEIIDINMGCPAKKVCNVMAGSALLRDEKLVGMILNEVVRAVDIPVTLKIRTGWDKQHRNGTKIAMIAEDSGIKALAVHGRTRRCGYSGVAEYDTIGKIKSTVNIPIIANGDITTPQKAVEILNYTNADAIMIGRAAQGNPWIFREINHYLETGNLITGPTPAEICNTLLMHLRHLYEFYDEYMGVRIARKHINWYCKEHPEAKPFLALVNQAESADKQLRIVEDYFSTFNDQELAA